MKNIIIIGLLCIFLFSGCGQPSENTNQRLLSSIEEISNSLILLDKQFPELSNEQKFIVEKLIKENNLNLLSSEALIIVNRYLKIAELDKNLSKFKDSYVELNKEENLLINELDKFNRLPLLSETSQEIWLNFKIIRENLPTDVTLGQLKKLNDDLADQDVYSLLTVKELDLVKKLNAETMGNTDTINKVVKELNKDNKEVAHKLVEQLHANSKLVLLTNMKAREVAMTGLDVSDLDSTLILLDKNYPKLNSDQKALLEKIDANNKLASLSQTSQDIWTRSKDLERDLITGVSIESIKNLNNTLSDKDVYDVLTLSELELLSKLQVNNKINLLVNLKAQEVGEKGLELSILNAELIVLGSDNKEYPELGNEEKRLLRDIESKNKLSSLSKVAQDIWIRSKLLEGLPTGVNIAQLKKLNNDLEKLSNAKVTELTEEQIRIIELLNKYGKLDLLTSSISKDVVTNYMLTMKQVRVVESYISNNREALEGNNYQKIDGLLNILRDSNLIIDINNVDKPLFSLMKVSDKGIYNEKNTNTEYSVKVESGKYFPLFDKGYFWLIDNEGKIRNGDNPSLCLGIDRGDSAYVIDCSSSEWQSQITFDVLGVLDSKEKVMLRNKDNKCLNISEGNVIGDINTCNDMDNNISNINKLDDLIWSLLNKEDKDTLLKVIKNKDLSLPKGVTDNDYWHLDKEVLDFYNNSNWQFISDRAYNTYRKLVESNKLYLVSPTDINKTDKAGKLNRKRDAIVKYIRDNKLSDIHPSSYNSTYSNKRDEVARILLEESYPIDIRKEKLFMIPYVGYRSMHVNVNDKLVESRYEKSSPEKTWILDQFGQMRSALYPNLCITYQSSHSLVKLTECNKQANQRFYIWNRGVPSGKSLLKNDAYCIDDYGSKIGMYSCHAGQNQLINYIRQTNSWLYILPNDVLQAIMRMSLSIHHGEYLN